MGSSLKKISVAMIVRNEEHRLGACLDRLRDFPDIILVDAESTDLTLQIAGQYPNVRILSHAWTGYVDQRNYADLHTTNLWVLALDADEYVTDQLVNELRSLEQRDFDGRDAFRVPFVDRMWGKTIRFGNWGQPSLRLYEKTRSIRTGHLHSDHDRNVPLSRIGRIQHHFVHDSHTSVDVTLEKFQRYSTEDAELLLNKFRISPTMIPILHLCWETQRHFWVKYVIRGGFLEGWRGLFMALLRSYYVVLKYVKFFERHQDRNRHV